jgi:hypothetical protein
MSEKQTLSSVLQMQQEINKLIEEKGKDLLSEELQGLFNNFPIVNNICFSQSTPHFNDGDPCTNSMDEIYINGYRCYMYKYKFQGTTKEEFIDETKVEVSGEDHPQWNDLVEEFLESEEGKLFRDKNENNDIYFKSDWEVYDLYLREQIKELSDEEKTKLQEAFYELNILLDEDLMEQMFGTNTVVTITKEGVSVEEYYCGY